MIGSKKNIDKRLMLVNVIRLRLSGNVNRIQTVDLVIKKVLLKCAIFTIVTSMLIGTIQTIFNTVTLIVATYAKTIAALELMRRAWS